MREFEVRVVETRSAGKVKMVRYGEIIMLLLMTCPIQILTASSLIDLISRLSVPKTKRHHSVAGALSCLSS